MCIKVITDIEVYMSGPLDVEFLYGIIIDMLLTLILLYTSEAFPGKIARFIFNVSYLI